MISKSNYKQFLNCTCELWLHKQRRDLLPEAGAMLERFKGVLPAF